MVDQKRISIFVGLLLIAVGGVYYFSEDSSESLNEVGSRSAPHVDSLTADNRPSITAQRDTVLDPVGEGLPPGTALIRTTVLSVEEDEGEIQEITVRVEEVLGYGSSTSPITTDTKFSFEVSHYLERNPDFKDKIAVDGQVKILVSYQEGISTAESDKSRRWSLVEIKSAKEK